MILWFEWCNHCSFEWQIKKSSPQCSVMLLKFSALSASSLRGLPSSSSQRWVCAHFRLHRMLKGLLNRWFQIVPDAKMIFNDFRSYQEEWGCWSLYSFHWRLFSSQRYHLLQRWPTQELKTASREMLGEQKQMLPMHGDSVQSVTNGAIYLATTKAWKLMIPL